MTYDIKCVHCKRFLGTTDKSTEVTIKCSNSSCKKLETYKVTFMSDIQSSKNLHVHKVIKEKE